MARRVTAVILAGGESSRFGQDKAFAVWEKKPFLHWVGRAVSGVSDSSLILVPPGSSGRPYAEIVPGATVVPDRAAHAGPVEALRGVKDLLRTPTILVVPCDAPGLPSGLARRLVATCEELKRPAVAATADGRLFSLFSIPRDTLLARLPSAKSLEDLVADAESVLTDAAGLNVNEPESPA